MSKSQKIIINHNHNLSKIHSIIKSKSMTPEVLVLESKNTSLNLKTNSIAYKLIMADNWIGIETRRIKRNIDNNGKLLRITLINHKLSDKYRLRHKDAEVIK